MFFFDGIGQSISLQNMESTGRKRTKVFSSRLSWLSLHCSVNMKTFSHFCSFAWPVHLYVCHQRKRVNRKNETAGLEFFGTIADKQPCSFLKLTISNQLFNFSQVKCYEKNQSVLNPVQSSFLSQLATLRKKRKLET